MSGSTTDIAFTASVKAEQSKRGSRAQYQRVEDNGGWRATVTPELAAMLAGVRSFYLATANAEGQPYIQHRGGPPGFLRVLGPTTLGFADYGGNKQYITLGNLKDNSRAYIFVMDYARRQRVKLWGRARVVEDDAALIAEVGRGAAASPERAIVFEIAAWDRNCPQHIPRMLLVEDVLAVTNRLEQRIAELETENADLRRAARG